MLSFQSYKMKLDYVGMIKTFHFEWEIPIQGRFHDFGTSCAAVSGREQYIKAEKQAEYDYDVTFGKKAQKITFSNRL